MESKIFKKYTQTSAAEAAQREEESEFQKYLSAQQEN